MYAVLRMPRETSSFDAGLMKNDDVDCAGCISSERCWAEKVSPAAGFLVRREHLLAPGEVLVRQHHRFEGPYVVTSGCVGVTELRIDGVERIVAFRVPGEMIGLESCHGATHRFGAAAVSSASVCRLRWSAPGIDGRSGAVLRALLAKSSRQLEFAAQPWAGLPARERVRAFIDDFRSRTDQPLPMTRAQIGSYLGLAEETVVRALRRTGRRGVPVIHGR
jgi:CRP/FNR family transcriptional regulator